MVLKDLVIYGSGGFGREVCLVAEDINSLTRTWNILGFLDDTQEKHGTMIGGYPVLGDSTWLERNRSVYVVLAVGSPAAKWKIHSKLNRVGHGKYATLCHPTAWIGRRVSLGDGTVVCANSSITCDITIGRLVIINLNCTVGHDSVIADLCTMSPGVKISGNVRMEDGCELGTNAVVVPGVTLGGWSVVGAGAVVARSLPANVTAVGIPAKVIKEHDPGWHDN